MPQKGTEKRRSSQKMISTDKAALLWMYCKEIAPFETPTFSKNVGEFIARATRAPGNAQSGAPNQATDKFKRGPQAVKTAPSRSDRDAIIGRRRTKLKSDRRRGAD
jgi:hypothetical protein